MESDINCVQRNAIEVADTPHLSVTPNPPHTHTHMLTSKAISGKSYSNCLKATCLCCTNVELCAFTSNESSNSCLFLDSQVQGLNSHSVSTKLCSKKTLPGVHTCSCVQGNTFIHLHKCFNTK